MVADATLMSPLPRIWATRNGSNNNVSAAAFLDHDFTSGPRYDVATAAKRRPQRTGNIAQSDVTASEPDIKLVGMRAAFQVWLIASVSSAGWNFRSIPDYGP